jgi:hypothetical protein
MDKHHLKKDDHYAFLDDSDEAYGNHTLLHFHNYLLHADLLVARDNTWRRVLLYED